MSTPEELGVNFLDELSPGFKDWYNSNKEKLAAQEAQPKVPKQVTPTGNELYRKRVRVSFDFDVTVNDGKITHSGNDEEVQALDLALLKQFLIADKDKLREMIAYHIALELNLAYDDDIEKWIVGHEVKAFWEHDVYGPAIDQLEGKIGDDWREIRDVLKPHKEVGDVLSTCTETIFDCFKVQFVEALVEMEES